VFAQNSDGEVGGMEPIIALLTLVAQHAIQQQAILDALIRKGVVSIQEVQAEMPKTEAEAGRKFDQLKAEFFTLWSNFGQAKQ
jgi:hypothetical protein